MSVKIIADPGSCHMQRKDYALELIRVAAECGADAVKFQLFSDKPPNIPLPYEWLPELVMYGNAHDIEVFGSVWDEQAVRLLLDCGCKSVKFAYSMRNQVRQFMGLLDQFDKVYVSGDILTDFLSNHVRLYCDANYTQRYDIDFDGLFPERFHGASIHELGSRQTLRAVAAGAKYIERHYTLDYSDITVPDAKFALRPNDLKQLVMKIRDN